MSTAFIKKKVLKPSLESKLKQFGFYLYLLAAFTLLAKFIFPSVLFMASICEVAWWLMLIRGVSLFLHALATIISLLKTQTGIASTEKVIEEYHDVTCCALCEAELGAWEIENLECAHCHQTLAPAKD